MYKRLLSAVLCLSLLITDANAAKSTPSKANAYIILDSQTESIIEEENSDSPLPCAGLVRLMSLLLICECLTSGAVSYNDAITVSPFAAKQGGTSVFLDSGSTYPLYELFKAAIICSANDAICAIVEHICGSEDAFVSKMNERAAQLSLNCTFTDCTGLNEDTVSAKDLAKICCELSKHPIFFKYSSIWLDTFTHSSGRTTEMASSNILIKEDFDGMATSSSSNAGYCLAASKKCGSTHFICIVLGDSKNGRFSLARSKINAAASEFIPVTIVQAGSKVAQADVEGAKKPVPLTVKEDLVLLLSKSEAKNINKSIELTPLCAPVKKGESAGTLTITLANKKFYKLELFVSEDVEDSSLSHAISLILHCWLNKITD